MPEGERGWRESHCDRRTRVGRLTTNLVEALTHRRPRAHGVYYKGLVADRLLYRDAQGALDDASLGEQRRNRHDRTFPSEETVATTGAAGRRDLVQEHPGDSLFLLLPPNARRFPQPLLLDPQAASVRLVVASGALRQHRARTRLSTTRQGLSAMVLESTG